MPSRELTANERAAVKKLVMKLCANYDGFYKLCLALDWHCFMFGKCWTGGYCKYFKNAVLPLDTSLMAAMECGVKTRHCSWCDELFPVNGKRAYCSEICTNAARKKRQRDYMRKRAVKF